MLSYYFLLKLHHSTMSFIQENFAPFTVIRYNVGEAGSVVGRIKIDCKKCEVMLLDVDRQWRNQGIGSALLNHGEKVLTEHGCKQSRVFVGSLDAYSEPPNKFYEKNKYMYMASAFSRCLFPTQRAFMHKVLMQ